MAQILQIYGKDLNKHVATHVAVKIKKNTLIQTQSVFQGELQKSRKRRHNMIFWLYDSSENTKTKRFARLKSAIL